ncbi:hypothetical protein TNCV_4832781 [Trichonephila clavipes]|nr:hypothetical protein TNCV_4832781 [Trichonephila clavipes]
MTEKSEETSSNSYPGVMRGTGVMLEISITVWITQQHKRMEVITQKIYVPATALKELRTRTKEPKQCHEKKTQTMTEPPCPCTVLTWHARSMVQELTPYSQPPVGIK